MPKSLDADYQTALNTGGFRLILAVLITPVNGPAVGWSTSAFDFTYDGVDYSRDDAVAITVIESASGSEIERLRITGVLGSTFTKAMLRAGYLDNAEAKVFSLMYSGNTIITANGEDVHAFGYIGDITLISDVEFEAEIRDVMQVAAVDVNRETSQLCPFVLYGAKCGLSETGHTATEDVTDVSADGLTLTIPEQSGKLWKRGWVEPLEGDNEGVKRQIKSHSVVSGDDVVVLYDRFPYTLAVGTSCKFREGCDKSPARCQDLGNFDNFGGHPNIPGEDKRNMTVLV